MCSTSFCYFKAPVDTDIINAISVGSAGTIRFFLEHQRTQVGSLEAFDWPILLQELPVAADGSVVAQLPANLPLFEQIRTPMPEYKVPLTGRETSPSLRPGAAHVAGLNFGRPGEVSSCVGCHAGHSMIPLPKSAEDAKWTNLASSAKLQVSSVAPFLDAIGLVDRKVMKGRLVDYWFSDPAQDQQKQWVQLTFPVTVTVSSVRLYNLRQESDNTVQVHSAAIKLFRDEAGTIQVAGATTGRLSDSGTTAGFGCVQARVVRIDLSSVSGAYVGKPAAGLAEVEVIASAGEARPRRQFGRAYCPVYRRGNSEIACC